MFCLLVSFFSRFIFQLIDYFSVDELTSASVWHLSPLETLKPRQMSLIESICMAEQESGWAQRRRRRRLMKRYPGGLAA